MPDETKNRKEETEVLFIDTPSGAIEEQNLLQISSSVDHPIIQISEDDINFDKPNKRVMLDIVRMGYPFVFTNVFYLGSDYLNALMVSRLGPTNLAALSIAKVIRGSLAGFESAFLMPVAPMVG